MAKSPGGFRGISSSQPKCNYGASGAGNRSHHVGPTHPGRGPSKDQRFTHQAAIGTRSGHSATSEGMKTKS